MDPRVTDPGHSIDHDDPIHNMKTIEEPIVITITQMTRYLTDFSLMFNKIVFCT